MKSIIENDFRGVDLNLLLVFRALMEERSVTRAAQRLYLGQPAVSGALKRLRQVVGDALFVRTPHGMEPTPRALELARSIEPLLQTLHQALKARPGFEAATAQRIFHLGLSDALELALMQRLAEQAPGVRLITRNADARLGPAMVDAGEVELAIGVFRECAVWQRLRPLFNWRFVAVYNPQLVKSRCRTLSLEEFLSYPHVLTSFSAELRGFIDEQLELHGRQRQVVFSSPFFVTSPFIVQQVPAITSVPDYLARIWRRTLRLAVSPLPISVPEHDMSLLWSAANEHDPGLQWLLQTIAAVGAAPAVPE